MLPPNLKFLASVCALAISASAVPASSKAPSPSPTVQLATGTLETKKLAAFLDDAVAQWAVSGLSFALINYGKVVFSHQAGLANTDTGTPVTQETIFEGASLSKPLFGAFVVHLANSGVIDLDRSLAEYLPQADLSDDPRASLITARMVLTHQTGLPNWRPDLEDKQLSLLFEPGQSHSYSGEGYEYLADVLMHILDTDDYGLDRKFKAWLTFNTDIEDTAFVQTTEVLRRKAVGYKGGQEIVGGIDYRIAEFGAAHSIHSNAINYARAMSVLIKGEQFSAAARQEFFRPQGVPIPADDPQRQLGLVDWALGFSVYQLPMGRFYVHGGNNLGFSNLVVIEPERGWGIVILTNEDQATDFLQSVTAFVSGLQ